MVLFYTHLLMGVTAFLLIKDSFLGGNTLILFLIILLGSILPDIDERRSKINTWTGVLGYVVALFSRHRGFFHSLLFFISSSLVMGYYWNSYYAGGLFLGYSLHLLGDGFTRQGVQIFYPFSDFKISGPIKVGGIVEVLLVLLLIVTVAGILFFLI
ncbi:MAG: metal-dependent hydrolase [Nanoarchaeota archaeon]|nr:metal-dependent hydrolase [Nanoarchaeota archaeon]MBU1643965.1 metal-dependent hydrolase [Nanoarchaeota archaeon]MBU1976538.1 metal-dependent hydrolase [Nanoarchaeota archaeon]